MQIACLLYTSFAYGTGVPAADGWLGRRGVWGHAAKPSKY